jgi:hypothetical protein
MDLSIILNIELKRNWRFFEIGNRYATDSIILFNFKIGSGMGTNGPTGAEDNTMAISRQH